MSHLCPDCGLEHESVAAEPVIVDTEPLSDAAVEIARIEADRDVTVAKIEAKERVEVEQMWQEERVANLEGQLTGMREMLERIAPPEPDPEPVPVVVTEPEPEPVPEPVVQAPPPVEPASTKKKKGNAFWD